MSQRRLRHRPLPSNLAKCNRSLCRTTLRRASLSRKLQPKYPKDARNMRIQGPVVLQVVINDSGEVRDVRLATGHPLLAPAAIDAVKQWKFRPYELNGKPVEIVTMITLNFQLH